MKIPVRVGIVDNWISIFEFFLLDNGFSLSVEFLKEDLFKNIKYKIPKERTSKLMYFENDVFIIHNYIGDNLDIKKIPKFIHKPSGFWLNWSSYPRKGLFSHCRVSTRQFIKLLEECSNSLK